MRKSNPFKIEILKDGKWLVLGTSKTMESAHKAGKHGMKKIRGQDYRIVRNEG